MMRVSIVANDEPATATRAARPQRDGVASSACREFEVALPASLRHIAASTPAMVTGNPDGPVIVVLGGISANRFVCPGVGGERGWWPGLTGIGCAVDPARHLILGIDFAADESGRVAPTTAEQAEVVCAALDAIGIERAEAAIGASYGGMVALALAQHHPGRVGKFVAVSAPAEPHPSSTAIRELQRRVVALGLASGDGDAGLGIARGMAMMTYRTPEEFAERFAGGIPSADPLSASEPGAYLRRRGEAYPDVMSPERFLSISGSIDRHKVDPRAIEHPVLVIGALSDQLVPPDQVRALAEQLPNAELHLLDCLWGHDMFLKDSDRIGALVGPFLDRA